MDLEVVREQWEMQSAVPTGYAAALAEVRRAVALVAAASKALLGEAGASLDWLADARAFATPVVAGKSGFRLALAPAQLLLQVTDADGKPQHHLALAGRSPADAWRWLGEQSAALGKPLAGSPASGAAFAFGPEAAFEDIARSYGNAARALLCVRALAKTDETVRVAPEALHVVCGVAFGGGQSVGIGFAPGDTECAEPYFYAKPCPLPSYDADTLGELEGGGEWKTDGSWFGCLLRRPDWVWYDAEQLQAGAAVSFLDSCIDATRALAEK
jgi:hypothetical protein